MTNLMRWRFACLVFTICAATALVSPAQIFRSLASFNGANGAAPTYMTLVQGLDGNFYGTASAGGTTNNGTVFRVTPDGAITTLYNFCSLAKCADGSAPQAGLLLGTDGNFYGTTDGGGLNQGGTVFKVTSAGKLTTLYNFCSEPNCSDGSNPYSSLIQAIDGNFYGTTYSGGFGAMGTAYRLTRTGVLTTLHSFYGYDGANPQAGLVQATNGNLYGVAFGGGTYMSGTAFEITADGDFKTLYNFGSSSRDGQFPGGGLVQATADSLYGTTATGGVRHGGTVFEVTLDGAVSNLFSFDHYDGFNPEAALVATQGNLFGTTAFGGNQTCNDGEGCGTIFQISPDGALTLYEFCSQANCVDGDQPFGGLLQATDGKFYGVTYAGGGSNCKGGCGTIYRLSVVFGPFVKTLPAAGKVGTTVGILGSNLSSATSVTFNGTAAQFSVKSATLIVTSVPSGATTGEIKVTLSGGMLASNVPFYVLK